MTYYPIHRSFFLSLMVLLCLCVTPIFSSHIIVSDPVDEKNGLLICMEGVTPVKSILPEPCMHDPMPYTLDNIPPLLTEDEHFNSLRYSVVKSNNTLSFAYVNRRFSSVLLLGFTAVFVLSIVSTGVNSLGEMGMVIMGMILIPAHIISDVLETKSTLVITRHEKELQSMIDLENFKAGSPLEDSLF